MKTKRKLNGFDLFLALVLVVLIVGLVVKFGVLGRQNFSDQSNISATFVLKVSPVRSYTVDQIQVGDTVYYGTTSTEMGTVSDVSSNPIKEYANVSEPRYDLFITVETTCEKDVTDGITSYHVGEITLLGGRTDSYHTKYASFSGQVQTVSISE